MNEQRKRAGVKAPISAHPAFPAIVASWFAGLLGLGTLVLPVTLFERLSVASGLATAVGAAEPPLGLAARLLIALTAAVVGGLIGLAIARRIVAADRAQPSAPVAPEADAAPAKRPILAHDELGEEGFDADLSGALDEVRASQAEPIPAPGAAVPTPLDLADFAAPEPEDEAHDWLTEDRKREEQERAEFVAAPASPGSDPVYEVAAPAVAQAPEQPEYAPVELGTARPLGELGTVELVERFARALKRHQESGRSAGQAEGHSVVDMAAALASKPAAQPEQPHADTPAAEDSFEEPADGSYSSLLAMKSPFAAPRDRPALGAPRETERALRDALEKLQALSGAA